MDELLDILDESGRPTGEVVPKSEAHRLGLWHRCFHCWICGSDSGGPYLLLQRRAAAKDTWPNYLDVTAAGHLAAGEETLDGLREVEEELGLRIEPERLVPLGTRRVEREIPGGCDRELHEVFLVFDATPPGDLRLQKEEVEAVFRLDLDDVQALYETGSAPAREYAGGRTSATRIHLAEFVPKEEGYLSKVAGAARRHLSGVPPTPVF
ncbi:MAG TPA: NUDIX domain-containing protein [Rubrobacter sp.]|nr:NUDIX domain-containing protein [Rubrobacter sp.]